MHQKAPSLDANTSSNGIIGKPGEGVNVRLLGVPDQHPTRFCRPERSHRNRSPQPPTGQLLMHCGVPSELVAQLVFGSMTATSAEMRQRLHKKV